MLRVALVFGHFGAENARADPGSRLAVCPRGLHRRAEVFRNFKQNAKSYILLGFIIILTSALTAAADRISAFDRRLMVGLMTKRRDQHARSGGGAARRAN